MAQADSADVATFARLSWPAHPRQLALIRTQVRIWLTPLTLTEDVRDDLVLAVSEAASNSVEHAYRPPTPGDTVELTFWTEAHVVCIEIVDDGAWRVPAGQPTGRGVEIMQRLVAFVLIHYDARGTRVHLRHPLAGRSTPRSASQTAAPDRSGGAVGSTVGSEIRCSIWTLSRPRRRKRMPG